MKRYRVKSAPGQRAVLDVLSEGAEGYQVRITRTFETYEEVEEQFMSAELFDICLRTAYIREITDAGSVQVA